MSRSRLPYGRFDGIPLLIIAVFLLSACSSGKPAQRPPVDAAGISVSSLGGVWSLYRDDDYADNNFPEETLYFHKDGVLFVKGPEHHCGSYGVTGEHLVITVPHHGREKTVARKFMLDSEGLHLTNRNGGFAHYRRLQALREYCRLYEPWSLKSNHAVSFKLPPGWTYRLTRPDDNGVQQFQATNKDKSKQLIMIRFLRLEAYKKEALEALVKEIANKVKARTPLHDQPLETVSADALYSVEGPVCAATHRQSPSMTLKAVGRTMSRSTVVLVDYHTRDRLKEIEYIARSIYVDEEPISSESI